MVCHYVFENCNIVQFALQLNNFAKKIAKTITHGVIIILLPLPPFKIKSQLKLIPPSYPTCFPYPYLWNLGVGEAGLKNVGEAENLCF